jgi:hypothetical protein
MDRFMIVCLSSTVLFILIGILFNYPRKNKTGIPDDSGSEIKTQEKEIMNDERSKNRFNRRG